ncbi:helicase-related protein [Georgenia yuyongxinii]|uniref:helicase-related protein n=1 Tax=Georgenia yuyongxinii TaxID=2589797 RepID=UPI001E41FEA2|nr:helicase-related protein [Georgenia yuyongxinii]
MSSTALATEKTFTAAPGSVVVVRDQEWLVTGVERAPDGWFVHVQGLSELVRDTEATFSTALDNVVESDPRKTNVVADDSPGYRKSRLWIEAMLRKTAVPVTDPRLTVAHRGLADPLPYQVAAVRQALDPENLRPRILLADAVGLGKTIEIGMILAELVRRGRGERILVVTPRHVLEQMQRELWTRFALPFVRLDSVGIQRIRQKLPANRNPFAFYKRVIVSIDTLKSDRYLAHLEKQRWDAVVIDESHNVTNYGNQNNRLARLLSTRTDALILASATPHNGRAESFAELVRMLEPSAVRPDGSLDEELVKRLIIRRHRHSPDVASTVGADWAERLPPRNIPVAAAPTEDEIAEELERVWLYPEGGLSPASGRSNRLFPWTLAKAFLSSPAALLETVKERRRRIAANAGADQRREDEALDRLEQLARRALDERSAKYDKLVEVLREIGVGARFAERAVVFAERVPTLRWLQQRLVTDLGMEAENIAVLHGGLDDVTQQDIVESFKQASSPIRVLVTGDVASEGVNLHTQCHQLIHFDIPWSLIRIEQRNGRIDRYGQRHRPQINTLLLQPSSERFKGDIRVLTRLIEKEHEAHKALGDSASLMGEYDVKAEEDAIAAVLAGQRELDDVVKDVDDVAAGDGIAALFARLTQQPTVPAAETTAETLGDALFETDLAFLDDALNEVLETPASPPPNGVSWRNHAHHHVAELVPQADLRQRLEILPQPYLAARHVTQKLMLATNRQRGQQELDRALSDETQSAWPEASFLAPLHPVLDWVSDRALANLGRDQVFAVRGDGEDLTVVLQGTLTNQHGQVVATGYLTAAFPNADNSRFCLPEAHASATEALVAAGFTAQAVNTGAVPGAAALQRYVGAAVDSATPLMADVTVAASTATEERVRSWLNRTERWDADSADLVRRTQLLDRKARVDAERALAETMLPSRTLVRPLLVIVPKKFEPSMTEGQI